jgi:5-methylcytosine-specific restriction endonuclease McrA
MANKKQKYVRNGIFSIDEVLPHVDCQNETTQHYIGDDGISYPIRMWSSRYKCFSKFGIKCVCCGIEGSFFALERDYKCGSFHFNLYAFDMWGKEVLMTKDHIVPKSKDGKNHLSNYQPMCVTCNRDKGDKFPSIEVLTFIADRERKITCTAHLSID